MYNSLIEGMRIPTGEGKWIDIGQLFILGYIKNYVSFIFKMIVYYVIQKHHKIFVKKFVPMTETLQLDTLYGIFEQNKFDKVLKLLRLFEDEAEKKLLVLYRKR